MNRMSELIRKQDALDALGEEPPVWYDGEDEIAERNQWRRDVNAIKGVPPVQSEIHFDEWCVDCKEYDHEKHCCPRFNKVIRETVEEMKEAQSKTGKWIKPTGMMPPEYMGVYRCSECGEIAMRDWKRHYQTLTNYCPNCGCRMKEGEKCERNN